MMVGCAHVGGFDTSLAVAGGGFRWATACSPKLGRPDIHGCIHTACQLFDVIRAGSTKTTARRSELITRSNSAQSSCVPPAAVNTSRQQLLYSLGGETVRQVVGAYQSDLAFDGNPLPTGTEHGRGLAPPRRSKRSLTVDPLATKPTTGRLVIGSSRTPALTTEAWIEPSRRIAATTARP